MKKFLILALVVLLALSFVACANNAAPSASESVGEESSAGSDEEVSAAESPDSSAEGALKVALCMSGAANDQGWNQAAYEGAVTAVEKYGFELAYTENLEIADIVAAFSDYAAAGYDVIIGHGFEFGDPALEVAATYPDVKFICIEADASADNVASYVMACEQTAYVEGIIAANMTKTGKVGGIGPIQGDSLVKIINGFEDGAKSVNPDIEVKTAWTNSFIDTQLAQEAATAMIEDGVDVIKHCANACGNGAISAAVEADIWCQGDSYDQSSLAPDNILDSALYKLDVVLDIALGSIKDGSFKGDVYNLGMADNAVEVLLSDNLPDDVAETAQKAIDGIISGDLVVVRDYTVRN